VDYPRPLTETEKAVLLRVLEMTDAPDLEKLRRQVEVATATAPCTCPCPSVGLAVDARQARPISHAGRLEVEVYYGSGAVMVWVDDGWLSNLETWWWSDDPPSEFPPLDSLRLAPPD
jgi:hypothetical protein